MTATTDESQTNSPTSRLLKKKTTFQCPADSPTTVDNIRAFSMNDENPTSDDTAIPASPDADTKKGRRLMALEMIGKEANTNSTIHNLRENLKRELQDKQNAAEDKLTVLGSIRDRRGSADNVRQAVAAAVAQQQSQEQSSQEEEEEEAVAEDDMDASMQYQGLVEVSKYQGLGVSLSALAPEQLEPKKSLERKTSNDAQQQRVSTTSKYSRMYQSLSVLHAEVAGNGEDNIEDEEVVDPTMCTSDSNVPSRRWQTRADGARRSNRIKASNHDEKEEESSDDEDFGDDISLDSSIAPDYDTSSDEEEEPTKTETPSQAKPKGILKRSSTVGPVAPQTPLASQSTQVAGTPTRSVLHSLYDEGKTLSLQSLSVAESTNISIASPGVQRRNTTTSTATPPSTRRISRRSTSNRKLQEESLHGNSQRLDTAAVGGGGGRRMSSSTRAQSQRRLDRRSQRSSATRMGQSLHSDDGSTTTAATGDTTGKAGSFRRTVSAAAAPTAPTTPKKTLERSSARENSRRESTREPAAADGTTPPRRERSRSRTRNSRVRRASSQPRTRRGANRKSASQSDLSKGMTEEEEMRQSNRNRAPTTRRSRQKGDRNLNKSRSDRNVGSTRRSRGDRNNSNANKDDEEFDQAMVSFMSQVKEPGSCSTLQMQKEEEEEPVGDATALQFDPAAKHNVAVMISPAPKKKASVSDSVTASEAEGKTDTKGKSPKKRTSMLVMKLPLFGKK